MPDVYPIETWTIAKPAVTCAGGLVASQHHAASDVGARVLAEGGNAVDAAVAASLAISTVEPWMSGLGGGGFMMVHEAKSDRVRAVAFPMVAPRGLDPASYPLTGGTAGDLFGWPAVVEDRNVHGYHSIAVPGHVAGLALALETFGTRNWAQSMAPAIELAEGEMAVDWYATLKITTGAEVLNRHEESRRVYLPNGFPPIGEWGGAPPAIRLGNLGATMRRLAEAGPRDFYEGEIAARLIADLSAGGNAITAEDLAGYRAEVVDIAPFAHRDGEVFAAPGLTAGPTLRHALELVAAEVESGTGPGAADFAAYARALLTAYRQRFETMGWADETKEPSCTTHLSVIDAEGNMVALTQTLLSLFGSKVMLPETGIMMNNGIMWFDPRPGQPNSISPGKQPLSNMCPTIARRADGLRIALGASGGRRIMPAVMQLLAFVLDHGMDLDAAMHQPRIDVSGGDAITRDRRLPADVAAALGPVGPASESENGVYPALYACPNAVVETADGRRQGAAFVASPWAKASPAN